MPKKGYTSITVKDRLYNVLEKGAETLKIKIPEYIQVLQNNYKPNKKD